MPSSTTTALSRQPLMSVFVDVPDPRDRRGVRHDLPTILSLAAVGVLAGCQSLMAIWEHATDLHAADLEALGLQNGQALPSESTIRRVLQDLDPDDLDTRLMSWFFTRTGAISGRTVIAVDGKTMRGARTGQMVTPHLMSVLDQSTGLVRAQQRVADKSNEIPALKDLLASHNLQDVVVTADAMHTQNGTAEWITRRGGHYVLTVKDNQPGLKTQLKALPWNNIPAITAVDSSHGRRVRRTIKAVTAPAWIDFPGAAQILQIRRTRTTSNRASGQKKLKRTTEVVYLICSVPMEQAQPQTVAAWARGHWGIENRLHWVRDVVFNEDHHQLRTANGPHTMATLRNLAINLIRLFHGPNTPIAATTRNMTRRPQRAINLLTHTPN